MKSLFEITLDLAKKSNLIDDIVVTTNDPRIFNKSKIKKYKNIMFLKRAKKISSSNSTMLSVIQDVEKKIEMKYDFFMLLQVTCPFRKLSDIENSIKKIVISNVDNIISVTLVDDYHPSRMYKINKKI